MTNPKPDKGQPTAREQALTRRAFDMSNVLGMRHMPPIVFETKKSRKNPRRRSASSRLFFRFSPPLYDRL